MAQNQRLKTKIVPSYFFNLEDFTVNRNIVEKFFDSQENLKNFIFNNCLRNYGKNEKLIIDSSVSIDGKYYLKTKIFDSFKELETREYLLKQNKERTFIEHNLITKYFLTDNEHFILLDSLLSRPKKTIEFLDKYKGFTSCHRTTLNKHEQQLINMIRNELDIQLVDQKIKIKIKTEKQIKLYYNYSILLDENLDFYISSENNKMKINDPDVIYFQPNYISITENNKTKYYDKDFNPILIRENESEQHIRTAECIEITPEEAEIIRNSNLIGLQLIS